MALHIGIIAGEASGDLLAAGLMAALQQQHPGVVFSGVGGPLMRAQGGEWLYPAEALSLMGLVEVIAHLPRLLTIRRALYQHFQQHPPAVFIGVDLPDFNLSLASRLKTLNIPTVHYVSPTVWAWRSSRVKRIAQAVDLMLTLFPFEADFYRQHAVPVRFVGHPLADMIDVVSDPVAARRALAIDETAPVVALLPGSRHSELQHLADCFIQTALWCCQQRPDLQLVVPLTTVAHQRWFQQRLLHYPPLPIRIGVGCSREMMLAADVVLLASGTATLEAMLLKRPMVVAYRLSPLTYQMARHLVKTPYIALPNLLAQRRLVPEFIQQAVQPEALGAAVLTQLAHPSTVLNQALIQPFTEIHHQLRQNASQQAAQAVLELIHVAT